MRRCWENVTDYFMREYFESNNANFHIEHYSLFDIFASLAFSKSYLIPSTKKLIKSICYLSISFRFTGGNVCGFKIVFYEKTWLKLHTQQHSSSFFCSPRFLWIAKTFFFDSFMLVGSLNGKKFVFQIPLVIKNKSICWPHAFCVFEGDRVVSSQKLFFLIHAIIKDSE